MIDFMSHFLILTKTCTLRKMRLFCNLWWKVWIPLQAGEDLLSHYFISLILCQECISIKHLKAS